jgi:peptidoglycan/LPS O-acetylase OafA/YrhL
MPDQSSFASTSGGRIPVLDGIRGVAILMVMVFHFWLFGTTTGTSLWERIYSNVAGMGWIGVDLFFVLSGFLITGILYDSRSSEHYYRVFYARRTVRIFPLYYASLALFFWIIPFVLTHIIHREFADTHSSVWEKLFAWTYLVNWYEGVTGFKGMPLPLAHFWSLAIEEQFYFVWPFLVLTVARRRLMAICCGLTALGLVSRMIAYGIHIPVIAYTWTFCRADSLAIGAVLALAARDPSDWKIVEKWALFLAICALSAVILLRILNPLSVAGPGHDPTFLVGTFGVSFLGIFFGSCLAVAVSSQERSVLHRSLSSPFLRFFGKYSYCLYVCHVPFIVFCAKAGLQSSYLENFLHSKFLAILVMNGIGFASTTAIALTSWNLFEKQFLKLKDLPLLQREERPPIGVAAEG